MTTVVVQYRRIQEQGSDASPWLAAGVVEHGQELVIPDLLEGELYEVRAREVLDDGSFGPWRSAPPAAATTAARQNAEGVEQAPPSPSNVRIERDGCLGFDHPSSGEDVRFEVRTAPDADTTWNEAQPVHDGLLAPGQMPLCAVPRGEERTILIAAVGANGARSEPAVLTVNRGPFDEGKAVGVESTAEEPTFSGTLTNFTIVGGELVQATESKFYGPRGSKFYAPMNEPFYGPRTMAATYEFRATVAAAPLGEDGSVFTLGVTTDAKGWRYEYRPHQSSAKFYGLVATPFYGAAGTAFYRGGVRTWRPWPGSLPVRDADDYDVRLVIPGGRTAVAAATVSAISWRVTRPSAPGSGGGYVLVGAPLPIPGLPTADTEIPGSPRTKVDLTNAVEVRVVISVTTPASSGDLWLSYSTDESSWSHLTQAASLVAAGTVASVWYPRPVGAAGDVFVRVSTSGGNNVDTPVVSNVQLQTR